MGRGAWIAVLLYAACGDNSRSTVSCSQLDVCMALPLAQVNAGLGNQSTLIVPSDQMNSTMTTDSCLYRTQETSVDAKFVRVCYPSVSTAAMTYQADHDAMLNPSETRMDASGVGDRSFFTLRPGYNEIEIEVLKANLLLSLSDNQVNAGHEGAVEQALIALANQLLAAN